MSPFGALLIGFVAEHLGVRVACARQRRLRPGGDGRTAPVQSSRGRIAHQGQLRTPRDDTLRRLPPPRRPAPRSGADPGRARHARRRIPAPLLAAGRLRARSRRTRRCACASSARISWSSAIAAGASACSTCTARIAARRSSSASRSSAASAAAITAGSTTSTAAAWRRRASPRAAACASASGRARIPRTSSRGLVFAYLGPPDRRPAFPLYDSYEVPGHHADARGRSSRCRATGSR